MELLRFSAVPVLFTVLWNTMLVSSTCYFSDGSIQDHPAFVACDQTVGRVSMCCGTNWTANNPTIENDRCEVNGLCLNNLNGVPVYWRGSCTDRTWKSPFCLKNLCNEFNEGGDPGNNIAVSQCDDGSWCCGGTLNATCCYKKLGVVIASTLGELISKTITMSSTTTIWPSSTGPATTSTTTSASTTSSTNVPTNTNGGDANSPQKSSGLSTGAKAGIGTGVAVGAIAALAALAFFFIKRRSTQPAGEIPKSAHTGYHAAPASPQELGYYGPNETRHELGEATPRIAELS